MKRLAILIPFVCIAAVAIGFAQGRLSAPTIPASDVACGVYASLLDPLRSEPSTYVAPTTRAFDRWQGYPPEVPQDFWRETGEMQEVGEMLFPVREPFDADVSEYFSPVGSSASVDISSCFTGMSDGPQFHSGPLWMLRAREIVEAWKDGRTPGYADVIFFSPVGISSDGSRAVLYVEQVCSSGGFCGGGGFYLLEKRETWTVIGDQLVWAA